MDPELEPEPKNGSGVRAGAKNGSGVRARAKNGSEIRAGAEKWIQS